jgi:hypothetical protein
MTDSIQTNGLEPDSTEQKPKFNRKRTRTYLYSLLLIILTLALAIFIVEKYRNPMQNTSGKTTASTRRSSDLVLSV